jgi:hypothetical protein
MERRYQEAGLLGQYRAKLKANKGEGMNAQQAREHAHQDLLPVLLAEESRRTILRAEKDEQQKAARRRKRSGDHVRPNIRQAVEWVFDQLDPEMATGTDPPSAGAKAMLEVYGANVAMKKDFFEAFIKPLMPARAQIEKESQGEQYGGKGIEEIIDRVIRENRESEPDPIPEGGAQGDQREPGVPPEAPPAG